MLLREWKIIWQGWSPENVASPCHPSCHPWGKVFRALRNLAFRIKYSSAGQRTWWVTDSGISWLQQISETFPILNDSHMAALLFAKSLAGRKEGFYGYNQNSAGTIISISVPGSDVLQKTVVRAKLLCGMGECSSASVWVLSSARRRLWTVSWTSLSFAR